ncbi:flagellin [Exiguobacterium aurantiacum]|uniref:flagellin N-terminal helical domain-containing protein n=1 Tax=Exiguobacterium aurantiacum TaxID=33987 RepID=UPI0008778682|nr:flagellin [Exiguobacterium aurantiacum]
MIINHNLNSMNAHRNMSFNTAQTGKAMEKLSSGLRINRAGDDAAGLAISEKMRGQIRGLDQATRNSQDGISLIQTAEGALNETHSILQRMRELAVQSSNDTNTLTDRKEIQKEMNSLTSEINRIGNSTEFNTQKLLNDSKNGEGTKAVFDVTIAAYGTGTIDIAGVTGVDKTSSATLVAGINAGSASFNAKAFEDGTIRLTAKAAGVNAHGVGTGGTAQVIQTGVAADATKSMKFQIGANESQSLTLSISDMRSSALGVSFAATTDAELAVTNGLDATVTEQALDVRSSAKAQAAIAKLDSAIETVSSERSKLGANQNRLDHTINNLSTSAENLQAAESRIRDVDMAKEMMNFTKNNILNQAAQAMMAQSNQQPQAVLQLLR